MSERYDIAIVGSGVAGLSAALNAKIRNKSFIIFGSNDMSTKLVKAPSVNNYLGFPGMSGSELRDEFAKHLDSMGIEITEERINNIYAMGDYYALMANDKVFEAKAVILATGVHFGKPFKGETELLGKGVGYCATCDAPLYKGKTVTIIAYNKHEESEANYVAELAEKVYYVPMYKEALDLNPSIEVIKDIPKEIHGEHHVNKLVLKNNELQTDAVFILRESISPAQLVPGLKISENHIEVDRLMKTNLEGCFAAGDVVGAPYQYIKAAGEGNIASLSAISYLDKKSI